MVTESIIVAGISLIGTLGGSYMGHRKSTALIEYRINELEEKVDKHNNLVERTYSLEARAGVLEEKVKNIEGATA